MEFQSISKGLKSMRLSFIYLISAQNSGLSLLPRLLYNGVAFIGLSEGQWFVHKCNKRESEEIFGWPGQEWGGRFWQS